MPKKTATLKDVARLAGVSTTTASVVLNGRIGDNTRVGKETQDRVWMAVQELGYVPNPMARSLQKGRSNILAVFTYELVFPVEYRNFYYPIFLGIEEEAARLGNYDLLLITSAGSELERRKIFRGDINRLKIADGAILLGLDEDKEDVNRLIEEGYPFVYIGRRHFSAGESSYVAPDYVSGLTNLIAHLAELGHQQVGYLYGTHNNEPSQDRLRGFLNGQSTVLQDHAQRTFKFPTREALTPAALRQILDTGVTALVAEAELGKQAYDLAPQLNLRIPEDFSLALAGRPLDPRDTVPESTILYIPTRELGVMAVRMILQLLEDPSLAPLQELVACVVEPGHTVKSLK